MEEKLRLVWLNRIPFLKGTTLALKWNPDYYQKKATNPSIGHYQHVPHERTSLNAQQSVLSYPGALPSVSKYIVPKTYDTAIVSRFTLAVGTWARSKCLLCVCVLYQHMSPHATHSYCSQVTANHDPDLYEPKHPYRFGTWSGSDGATVSVSA